jgi:DNA repair protein RadA/Sms
MNRFTRNKINNVTAHTFSSLVPFVHLCTMAKAQVLYFCQNCGAQSSKWLGRCPQCNEWNTYVQEVRERKPAGTPQRATRNTPVAVDAIAGSSEERIITPDQELNRVLGGGIVRGSLILVGGEPGIGKSTLMLQTVLNMKQRVLYITGEESESQLKMRADRIGIKNKECYILPETHIESLMKQAENLSPDLLVIDSIQTLYSEQIESTPGSVSQIRDCTGQLLRYAKESGTAVILIGHITKDGAIAGPKMLEHMVDTVLQFEGDRHHTYRILRGIKNRFGPASELGIYEMAQGGLREVSNPSEILISQREEQPSGVAICAATEGMRPLLIEIQALVSTAVYGTPQRSSTGFDARRLNMLLAVLEKRCGFRLGVQDVFLNIAGGLRIEDPAADLGVVVAILSSHENMPVPAKSAFAGEVGLSGEIRAISRITQRIAEAEKLGFEDIYISKYNLRPGELGKTRINVHLVSNIEEVFSDLFG